MALTDKLTAIGDAIRAKTGGTEALTLDGMVTAINGITTGGSGGGGDIPAEALVLTGSCDYKFAYNNWSWFFEENKGKITTKDLNSIGSMFRSSSDITEIPFDINIEEGSVTLNSNNIFSGTNITQPPYIKGKLNSLENTFEDCCRLNYIPEDWGDYIDWSKIHSTSCKLNMFYNTYSIRHIPDSILRNKYNTATSAASTPYYNEFNYCYALDELKGLAVQPSTVTSNMFAYSFNSCSRVKSITFATDDGVPKTAKWKSQTIDLSNYVGYVSSSSYILKYNSGITSDKQVTDDTTYQALKDDPDWFTTNIAYSRYNHDSAVATINSLPDTSAYLAEKGGTNTIKFKGDSGSSTDGGAINTLTEEEIAVATAKGWTVTLV